VATAFVYMLLALPMGRLADRFGRVPVFLGGYFFLGGAYTCLIQTSSGVAEVVVYVVLIGAYYAATDGVLMAIASAVLPENLRTSGLALLTTSIGLARFVASVLFGLVWTWQGMEIAVGGFIAGLVAAMAVTASILSFRGGGSADVETTG